MVSSGPSLFVRDWHVDSSCLATAAKTFPSEGGDKHCCDAIHHETLAPSPHHLFFLSLSFGYFVAPLPLALPLVLSVSMSNYDFVNSLFSVVEVGHYFFCVICTHLEPPETFWNNFFFNKHVPRQHTPLTHSLRSSLSQQIPVFLFDLVIRQTVWIWLDFNDRPTSTSPKCTRVRVCGFPPLRLPLTETSASYTQMAHGS